MDLNSPFVIKTGEIFSGIGRPLKHYERKENLNDDDEIKLYEKLEAVLSHRRSLAVLEISGASLRIGGVNCLVLKLLLNYFINIKNLKNKLCDKYPDYIWEVDLKSMDRYSQEPYYEIFISKQYEDMTIIDLR